MNMNMSIMLFCYYCCCFFLVALEIIVRKHASWLRVEYELGILGLHWVPISTIPHPLSLIGANCR